MPHKSVKICPYCGEENLDWAEFCTVCQGSLADARRVTASRKLRIPPSAVVGIILCAMAFGLLWTLSQMTQKQSSPGSRAPLKVLWHKFYTLNSQEWIVGQVRNEGPTQLDKLHVVGEFYADDSRTIEWSEAPLDTLPLLPGHTSHFKVLAPYDPEIEKSWFHFQTVEKEQVGFRR